MNNIKALTFDTGGTILDWHSGFREALKTVGEKYNYQKDWAFLSNELRRRSLNAMPVSYTHLTLPTTPYV